MLKTIFFPWKNIPPFFCHKSFLTYFCTPKNAHLALEGKDSVAQLVEQYTFNVWVLGSSPSGITSWDKLEKISLVPFSFWRKAASSLYISPTASFNLVVRKF